MRWLEVQARVPRDVADDLAAVLARFGQGGAVVEEEGTEGDPAATVTVKAYLPGNQALPARRRRLLEAVGHLSLIFPIPLEERPLAEEDWAEAWKAHFIPFRVGQRLVIKPSWRPYDPQPGELVLELDPGLAFGTGLHPSTRLCLQALEGYLVPGGEVLDLGTGSGILALAAARLGARQVLALDTDAVAVRVARHNVQGNGLAGVIKVRRGTITGGASRRTFDLVAANIVASVIQELAQPLMAALTPRGLLIAGGIVQERLEAVVAALAQAGGTALQVAAEGDWRTVVCRAEPETAPKVVLNEGQDYNDR